MVYGIFAVHSLVVAALYMTVRNVTLAAIYETVPFFLNGLNYRGSGHLPKKEPELNPISAWIVWIHI